MADNPHKHHRQRMRERFLASGLDDFAEHNIIEFLLFFGLPRVDTNELAHTLIDQFGSLAGVFDASYEELLKVSGVGEQVATLIKFIPAVGRQYQLSRTRSVVVYTKLEQLIPYLLALFHGVTHEECFLLCFDERGRLLSSERLSIGSANAVTINVRRICEIAVTQPTNTVVLAHNHLSGSTVPSHDDWETTRTVKSALHLLDISVLDHIIVSGNSYTSMASLPYFNNL